MSKRKAPCSVDNHNEDICNLLLELAAYEQNVNKNLFKSSAYRQAAGVLAGLDKRIESGAEAKKLKGIGQKIAQKIDEFLSTGKLKKLENIHKDETSEAIMMLTRVSGIGPSKARQLVELGVKTIAELKQHRDVLNHHQQLGLKYFDDFEKKIPRQEIEKIEEFVVKNVGELYPEYHITICGSYRRGQEESGDIDILFSHPAFISTSPQKIGTQKLEQVLGILTRKRLITDTISKGDVKFMGVCNGFKIGATKDKGASGEGIFHRIDVRMCPWDQYYCSVLYFTGNDIFNKNMRAHALQNKFTLNEYTLRPLGSTGVPGEALPIESEEDIFKFINYPYRHPKDRTN